MCIRSSGRPLQRLMQRQCTEFFYCLTISGITAFFFNKIETKINLMSQKLLVFVLDGSFSWWLCEIDTCQESLAHILYSTLMDNEASSTLAYCIIRNFGSVFLGPLCSGSFHFSFF